MKQLISDAHPILASMDHAETIAFYQRLGFSLAVAGDYVVMRRGDIELHFWKCEERHIAENTGCCIRSDDVDALYAEFIASGVTAKPPEDRAWGMREFYVIDPSGNLLRINQRIS
jgi:uncharacterized glyoxalase superfamily protein PhnB